MYFCKIILKESNMETNQVELLKILAKKIKSEKRHKEDVLLSLQSAKILTKQGNFTGHFRHLNQVFSSK